MDKDSLSKIVKIIKKTGDKIVVLSEGEPSLVMMSFKDYEKLVASKSDFKDLTAEELKDRINKEIAFYGEEQNDKKIENMKIDKETEIVETEETEDVKNMEEQVAQDYEVEPIK